MAFENLSDKLNNVFKNLRGKGRLSEQDVTDTHIGFEIFTGCP